MAHRQVIVQKDTGTACATGAENALLARVTMQTVHRDQTAMQSESTKAHRKSRAVAV